MHTDSAYQNKKESERQYTELVENLGGKIVQYRSLILFTFAVSLIVLGVVATTQLGLLELGSRVANNSFTYERELVTTIKATDRPRADLAAIKRWVALGEFYSQAGTHGNTLQTHATQVRWEAMGKFFTDLAAHSSELAATAEQARWDAKGRFFSGMESVTISKGNAATQARWQAMGDYFSTPARHNSDPATADQARWNARGLFYSNLAITDLERGNAAIQARWDKLGQFYTGLAGE